MSLTTGAELAHLLLYLHRISVLAEGNLMYIYLRRLSLRL